MCVFVFTLKCKWTSLACSILFAECLNQKWDLWSLLESIAVHIHYTCRCSVQARPCLEPGCSQTVYSNMWVWIALWPVSTVCVGMQWRAQHVSDTISMFEFVVQISHAHHKLCLKWPYVATAMSIASRPRLTCRTAIHCLQCIKWSTLCQLWCMVVFTQSKCFERVCSRSGWCIHTAPSAPLHPIPQHHLHHLTSWHPCVACFAHAS